MVRFSWVFKGVTHHTMPIQKIGGVWCFVENGEPVKRLEKCGDCGNFGVCEQCHADIERAASESYSPSEKRFINWFSED